MNDQILLFLCGLHSLARFWAKHALLSNSKEQAPD